METRASARRRSAGGPEQNKRASASEPTQPEERKNSKGRRTWRARASNDGSRTSDSDAAERTERAHRRAERKEREAESEPESTLARSHQRVQPGLERSGGGEHEAARRRGGEAAIRRGGEAAIRRGGERNQEAAIRRDGERNHEAAML